MGQNWDFGMICFSKYKLLPLFIFSLIRQVNFLKIFCYKLNQDQWVKSAMCKQLSYIVCISFFYKLKYGALPGPLKVS